VLRPKVVTLVEIRMKWFTEPKLMSQARTEVSTLDFTSRVYDEV